MILMPKQVLRPTVVNVSGKNSNRDLGLYAFRSNPTLKLFEADETRRYHYCKSLSKGDAGPHSRISTGKIEQCRWLPKKACSFS